MIKVYRTADAVAHNIEIPQKKTIGASGFDVQALMPYGDFTLYPRQFITVSTGLMFDIPWGYEIVIRGRSSLWFKHSVSIGQEGTIDSDYTGEVKVKLVNLGNTPFDIANGDRIAQAVVQIVPDIEMIECVGTIKKTDRGQGGFGSTGK